MHRTILLCFGLACSGIAVTRGEEVQPYEAAIIDADAPVHSGPGRNYYITGRLGVGATVEVYRHDQGGWLAIRPPEGSFSLVGSRYLRATSDGLATVLEDHVGARVGSLESPDRDVVQVRLSKGEQVQLLEPAPVTSPNSRQSWYMIAPPAGEFRWIHESRIDRRPAVAEIRPRRLPAIERERRLAPTSAEYDAAPVDVDSTTTTRGAKLATYQMDPSHSRNREAAEADERGWEASTRDTVRPAQATRNAASSIPTPAEGVGEARTAAAAPTRSGNLRTELDAIELALSQTVAQDASQWDFADINRRAERLLDQSATAVERGRSRLLLRKIARFEEIARGYADVRASGMQSGRPIAPIEALAQSSPATETTRPGQDRRLRAEPSRADGFVGVGRLTQVLSRRAGAPMFALVDDDRQVRYFVTPAAGVNLRSYVGKQVGVSGVATYNPTYSKQQLTAERIDILSDSVLRR